MRRAQRGRFPLVSAITKVTKELLDTVPLDNGADDELGTAKALLANAKKLALFLSGVAYQKFGDKLIEEQEIVASLSDIMIDTYLAESAVLRAMKAANSGAGSASMSDLTLIFVNEAVGRMELQARRALAATSEGDELKAQLGIMRRLLRWTPVNSVALRRRVAKRLCEVGTFSALVAGNRQAEKVAA